jgi:hypothetical protein
MLCVSKVIAAAVAYTLSPCPYKAGQRFHIKIFEKKGNSVIGLEPT